MVNVELGLVVQKDSSKFSDKLSADNLAISYLGLAGVKLLVLVDGAGFRGESVPGGCLEFRPTKDDDLRFCPSAQALVKSEIAMTGGVGISYYSLIKR